MITLKSPREIKLIEQASQQLIAAMDSIEAMIVPGTKLSDIDQAIGYEIRTRGGEPVFKGIKGPQYAAYPASSYASLNEQVIQGIPDERRLQPGDILKMQVGIKLDGYYSTFQHTYPVGPVSASRKRLAITAKSALRNAIECIRPGKSLVDVARAIQATVETAGYSVVKDFVGHGIGGALHEDPKVPNFVSSDLIEDNVLLTKGMVLQIIPMVNEGTSAVRAMRNGWTIATVDRKDSCLFGHIVAVEKNGPRVLTFAPRDQSFDETPSQNIAIIALPGRLHVFPLDDMGVHNIVEPNTGQHLIYGSASVICRRTGAFAGREIDDFETLINRKDLKEQHLQNFFEQHPQFLLGSDYQSLRSNIVLPNEFGPDLIPDFFLEPIGTPLWDILELKLPDKPLVAGPVNRQHFSHYVFSACAQLRTYKDYFDDTRHRDKVYKKYGLLAYKPRIAVIIGRTVDVSPFVWKQIQLDLPWVRIVTYDELLEKAKRRFLA